MIAFYQAYLAEIDSITDAKSVYTAVNAMNMDKWNAFVESMRAIPATLPMINPSTINDLDERNDHGFVAAPVADQLI